MDNPPLLIDDSPPVVVQGLGRGRPVNPPSNPTGTAAYVRALRVRLDLGQRELAELIGVSWKSIYRWESGLATPKADALEALRRVANDLPDAHHAWAAVAAARLKHAGPKDWEALDPDHPARLQCQYRRKDMRNAYLDGWQAGEAGRPADECPYRQDDSRERPAYLAWSRGHEEQTTWSQTMPEPTPAKGTTREQLAALRLEYQTRINRGDVNDALELASQIGRLERQLRDEEASEAPSMFPESRDERLARQRGTL